MHKSSAFQSAAISKIRCNSTINICYATESCVRLNDDLIFIWGKKINYYELWPDVRTNGLQFNNRIKCCSCIHLFISHNIENLSPTFCTKKTSFVWLLVKSITLSLVEPLQYYDIEQLVINGSFAWRAL